MREFWAILLHQLMDSADGLIDLVGLNGSTLWIYFMRGTHVEDNKQNPGEFSTTTFKKGIQV